MFSVEKKLDQDKVLYVLEGSLDAAAAPDLIEDFRESLEDITELTLDFENVDYISSAGLRALLFAQKKMNKQGSLTLIKVGTGVMKVLEVTGFADVLTIK